MAAKITEGQKVLSIYQKMQSIRASLCNKKIKKTGFNIYSKYRYYELGDFLPHITVLCNEYNLFPKVDFEPENAVLTIWNIDNTEEKLVFKSPMAASSSKAVTGIQEIGALETYQRRYLYVMAFEIAESDVMDAQESQNQSQQEAASDNAEKPMDTPIDEVKIKVIRDQLARTGVEEKRICEEYKIEFIEQMQVSDWVKCMNRLKKTSDKPVKQVDLGL